MADRNKFNDFLVEHAPLINMHANRLRASGMIPPHIDMADIHMAGVHGLADALDKYDPEVAKRTGKSFVDYAHSRIRGMMLDHVKDVSGVPKHLITQAKNLQALESQKKQSAPSSQQSPKKKS